MQIKNVAIVGLGALGILFGRQMEKNMPKGTLRFVADEKRQQRYRREGVFCNGQRCNFTFVSPAGDGTCADLLVFAVKAGALGSAIEDARAQVGPKTIVISLLNGISSEEEIGRAYGEEKLLYCVAQGMDATKTENHLIYNNMGLWSFGEKLGPVTPRVHAVAHFLDTVGIAYELPDAMQHKMWSKFMLNCGVNQAATVCATNYGGLQQRGPAREMMLASMREVMAISQKAGIGLAQPDIDYWMSVLDTLAAEGAPSMRQDALAKRKSEVDLFAGTVRRLGGQCGVPTPVNEMIFQKITQMEACY